MRIRTLLLGLLAITIAMPAIGYSADTAAPDQSVADKKKPLYWIDTMEPNIHYSKPGKSRMGMDLVPVYPGQEKSNDNSGANQ